MISGCQLSFLEGSLVQKLSAVSLKDPVLYEKRVPRRLGANDPRLGPMDRGTMCPSCYKSMEECQGHSGALDDLEWPVYYPMGMEYVLKVLRCICYYCNRLLIPPGSLRREYITRTYKDKARLWEMAKACKEMPYCGCPAKDLKFLRSVFDQDAAARTKKKKSSSTSEKKEKKERQHDPETSCGRIQPVYRSKKISDVAISAYFSLQDGEEAPRFNPTIIYRILCKISTEDAEAMGFHPEESPIRALMTWSLPVASTHIRLPTGEKGEDDLTVKYNTMIKIRNKFSAAFKKEPNPARSFHVTYSWPQGECQAIGGRYLWKDPEVECRCKQPRPGCPCMLQATKKDIPPLLLTSSSSALPPMVLFASSSKAGMIAQGISYKKKEKRDKSAVDLWNELQSEYFALCTGEYRKTEAPGSSQFGRSAARPSFGLRGIKMRIINKGGRVRGNLAGKRQDNSARTVICGSMDIDIDEVGVPYHFCGILTKEETVTDVNRHYLQHLLRSGEVNFIKKQTEDGQQELEFGVKYLNRDSTILEIGQKVDRWLQDGDYVQIGRQPSLHKPSTMVHRVRRLPPGIYTFLINLAVTPPYNADYDGDEMWLVVLQSYAAVIEARLLMHVPFQILSPQNARALIGFVYHSVLAAYHLGFRHVLFSREQFCQLLQATTGHMPKPAMTIKRLGPRWTGKQLFSTLLPANFNFEDSKSSYKKLVVRQGRWLTGYWTKASLGHLVLTLVRDHGYYLASQFISRAQRILKLFLDDYGATLGPLDLLNPRQKQTDSLLVGIKEDAREAKEQIAQHLAASTGSSSRLVHIIRSGTKGNPTNLMQLLACLGETMLLGSPIRFPTSHFPESGAESLAAKGFIASSFSTGLRPYESFCHFASGREGILDTANKTCRVGYLQRKMARMLGDLRVEYDQTVRDAEGRIVMPLFGDDGFQPSRTERCHIRFAAIQSLPEFERRYRHPDLAREFNDYLLPAFRNKPASSMISCPLPLSRIFSLLPMASPGEPKWAPGVLFAHVERLWHRLAGKIHAGVFWDRLAARMWPGMPTASQWRALEERLLGWYLPQGLTRPGEMVGPVTCQSIVEPAMQMTLRTFYLPGLGSINLQSGLDQLSDICNAAQSSATMTAHVRNLGKIHEVAAGIPGRFLKDYCSRVSVENQQTSQVTCPCLEMTRKLLSQSPGWIRAADYFLELQVKHPGEVSLVSRSLLKFFKKQTSCVLDCGCHVRVYLDRFHPLLGGRSDKFAFDLLLKDAKEKLCISGCSKIRSAHVVNEDKEILLLGSQTEAVWNLPEIDMTRTLPSDIREIETLFGIDAACLVLEEKLMSCMQKQGIPLDSRHAKLLAANMTRSGRIVPNTGLGVSTESKSALRKCTFEKMSSQLASEAACGAFDPVAGTVEALILSALPRMGSNYSIVHPPPASPASCPSIPTSYSQLRDVPTVPPSYEFVKRFMPNHNKQQDESYVPSTMQYAALGPGPEPVGPASLFNINLAIPSWIRQNE